MDDTAPDIEMTDKTSDNTETIADLSPPASIITPESFPPPEDMCAMFSIGDGQMVSLRDIMSIVYQCRFCGYSADTSAAVTTHVISTHLARQMTTDDVPVSADQDIVPVGNTEEPPVVEAESDTAATAQENPVAEESKEVFLCGQCSVVFDSIDTCKQHMVDDHAIPFSDMQPPLPPSDHPYTRKVSVATQSSIQKRPGRKRKEVKHSTQPNEPDSDTISIADDDNFESLIIVQPFRSSSRRQIRPPKALCEDYYLGQQKVRQHRNGNSISNDTPTTAQQTARQSKKHAHSLKCPHAGCTARFVTGDCLQLHLQCHTGGSGEGEVKFRCAACDAPFTLWRPLHMHLWKEHGHDMDLPRCSVCEFRADSAHKVATHAEIHSEVRPYVCPVCGKSFKQQSQLCNHTAIHRSSTTEAGGEGDGVDSGKKPRWYASRQCDICQRIFANQKCLRKHIEAVHSKLKPFVCRFCGYATSRKAMLQLHVRTHTGEKPFKCDICLYATGDHNTLRRHRMRHTGRKPYSCAHCSYTCIQAISLKSHLRSKHPGLSGSNMHSCTRCAYQTVNERSYQAHVRDHDRGLLPTLVKPPAPQDKQQEAQPAIGQEVTDNTWYATLVPEGNTAEGDGTTTLQIFAGNSEVDASKAPDVYAKVLQEIYASGMVATLVPEGGEEGGIEGVAQEGLVCAVPENGLGCNVLQMGQLDNDVVQIQGNVGEGTVAIITQVVGTTLNPVPASDNVYQISEGQTVENTTQDSDNTVEMNAQCKTTTK